MARDYKSRAQRKSGQKPSRPWLWLLVGYLAGAFSVALVWLKSPVLYDQGAGWIGAPPQTAGYQLPVSRQPTDKEDYDN